MPREPLDAPRVCLNRFDVKSLSASWRTSYRACRISRPPVVKSRGWRLVSDPTLDGERQDQPTQEMTQVVGDNGQEQADLIRAEPVARQARPMSGFLTFLDPLLRGPTLVVEVDDGPVRPRERRDDEAYAGKQFAEVMLDLGDHASRPIPQPRLILEAPIPDQRRMTRSAGRRIAYLTPRRSSAS